MGRFLATRRPAHGELRRLARALGYSERTLRTWRDREGEPRSPGHPPHSAEARRAALMATERVWSTLPPGHDGWRSVCAVLAREGVRVPTRLVQASLVELRRDARERRQQRIEQNRQHVEVLARNAVWAMDKMHVARDAHGVLEAEVVRETVAPHALGLSLGPPPCGADVVRLLGQTATERSAWPFVLQMDNGAENKNSAVETCLREHRVIALWNLPRTPQHNARAERTLGDLRRASGLCSEARHVRSSTEGNNLPSEPGVHATRTSLAVRLLRGWAQIDGETPREELYGLMPVELDRIAPQAEDRACRARFYADVCEELHCVALAPNNARARRMAEREAVWRALQRHGLVTRTRGGCPIPTLKAEGIS